MAHFAELKSITDPTGFTTDDHLVVQRVVVVGNDIATADGPLGENDMHVDGETWCQNFFKGGTWKQTSYNHNFRKQYCGEGMVYDSSKDKFLGRQPYASWSLDGNDDWQAPVTYPTITTYNEGANMYHIKWDEAGLKWTATDDSDPVNNFNWDSSALAWVSA
jgi:hypothetical protein|tara:strand:+ start:1143 stop:1628 length:486 start_codon:yes stop_codon:yes gene_type:complete